MPFFGSTHTLTAVNNNTNGPTGLPVITSEITISSAFFNSITRDSSAPPFRILAVGATGNLTLQNTTVSGGVTASDSCIGLIPNRCVGGGILNHGTLTLMSSYVSGNVAQFSSDGYVFDRGGGIATQGAL